jgi:hypothetical protein
MLLGMYWQDAGYQSQKPHPESLPRLRFRYLTIAGSILFAVISNTVAEVCDKDYDDDLPEVCK